VSAAALAIGDRVRALVREPWAPLAALALICVVSLAARAAWLGDPCTAPCRTAAEHKLVFDEAYYVNAARRIAGVPVPRGQPYATSPAGDDPNAEHPQLVKLIIAGSIELFGDGPFAWRWGSLLFGTLALLGMYALVRAAGGGPWLGVGAAGLMSLDNLLLVHGRIGTLDIYVVAFMIWSAALYLRGRWLLAGVVLGVGTTAKEVAPYLLLVLVLLELGRAVGPARVRRRADVGRALARVGGCAVAAGGAFVALLALFDRIAPPWNPTTRRLVGGGVFGHIAHMVRFADALTTSPRGPTGIESYPWEWLVDYKPIVYLNLDHRGGPTGQISTAHFIGFINPLILALFLPALWLAGRAAWREGAQIDRLGVAWVVGTWVPFELLSLVHARTSYLYYMVIVMPGVYVVVARLLGRPAVPRWAVWSWVGLAVLAVALLYPFTVLPDLGLA